MRLNAPLKRDLDGPAPDAADEVMLYQTIIGAWPLDLVSDDRLGIEKFRERVAAWQQKALREAKRHSGWAVPNEAYELAASDFLTAVLDGDRPARVVHELHDFVRRVAAPGALNSLSQMMLRLTSPGVPDLYQGTEFWDFSMVDPDNRRSIDYGARQQALEADAAPGALMADWQDGRVKQAVLHRVLQARAQKPDLFGLGSYVPLRVEGPAAEHAIAFGRQHGAQTMITVVSRLAGAEGSKTIPLLPPAFWQGTELLLPRSLASRELTDFLGSGMSGQTMAPAGRVALNLVLAALPVALLGV